MLIIEIAIGIVLAYLMITKLDSVITILGVGLIMAFYGSLVFLVVGGGIWLAMEMPQAAVAISIFLGGFVLVNVIGVYLSRKVPIRKEEAKGLVVLFILLAVASWSLWERYQEHGDISQELEILTPILYLLGLLGFAVCIQKLYIYKKHERSSNNKAVNKSDA